MKLIDYLPPKLAEIKELADFQEAVEPELKQIHEIVIRYLKNRHILDADAEGIAQWEEWLNIKPPPGSSLEKRRQNLIARMNERLPYDIVQLHRMLAGLLGWDNFEINQTPGRFQMDIQINAKAGKYDSAYQLLQRVLPAHVWWKLKSYLDLETAQITTCSFITSGTEITILPYEPTDIDIEMATATGSGALSTGQVITIQASKGD